MINKKIYDFIQESKCLDSEAKIIQRYSILENYFPNISNSLAERFIESPFYDFINENLQSHDWRKLKRQLMKNYGDIIDRIDTRFDKKSKVTILTIKCPDIFKRMRISNDPEFIKILDFFNYFVTIENFDFIHIEPKYSDDATDYVHNECNGIIYHIAKRSNLDSILENGLRCKEKSQDGGDYRTFPKRIYCIAINNSVQNIKEYMKGIVSDVFDPDEDYVILRINIRNTNIKFYKDYAMVDYPDCCYFTYTNIPASGIEKVIEL